MMKTKCKICRRVGAKLFLKGERCISSKCAMVKKPYAPGFQGKKRRKTFSEYAKQLREKQKLRNWYNLKEYQFKAYVKEVLGKRGKAEDAQGLLINKLEKRLDNVVFELGFATSRPQARQLVDHGHFLVNGRKVNIPSFQVRKGNKIKIAASAEKKTIFQNLPMLLKNHKVPSWLKLDIKTLEGTIVDEPSFEEAAVPAEVSAIFEFYSKA